MSGHSKWSQIKRKKAATDAARGRLFTRVIKEIVLAARQGGGDPESNARLRTAILAAKSANMPAANVERAILRGTGELEGSTIEEVTYEGYGPAGVAMLVECATDNRNRTTSEVRHAFDKHGGHMAEAGSVAYLFKPRGVLHVERAAAAEDALIEAALEAGADDVVTGAEAYEVLTPPAAFEAVRTALAARAIAIASAELTRHASLQVPVTGREAEAVLRLVDALEDTDDVQRVHSNVAISDEELAKLAH